MPMLYTAMHDIWVILKNVKKEGLSRAEINALHACSCLKQTGAGKVTAIVFEDGTAGEQSLCALPEVDRILRIPSHRVDPAAQVCLLQQMISSRKNRPGIILCPSSAENFELSARFRAKSGAVLIQNAVSCRWDSDKRQIRWNRFCMSGQMMEHIDCPLETFQVVTIAASPFWRQFALRSTKADCERRCLRQDHFPPLPEVLSRTEGQNADLTSAEIIVSGGRGVGGPEGFRPLFELAALLHGAVGASRASVDAGWIDHAYQIGQSGKTVAPRLYIACGISGSLQHQAGIGGAEWIAAINSDPAAPIFEISDFGIVGDVHTVIPALIAQCRQQFCTDASR